MSIWICVRLTELALEVHPGFEPDQPSAIIDNGRIHQSNAIAAELGISRGIRTSTAFSICAQLRTLERTTTREATRLQQLGELMLRFTPLVSLEGQDAVLLDVTGSLHLFDGLAGLLRQLDELCKSCSHQQVSSFAHTPTAALVLARAGQRPRPRCRAQIPRCSLTTLRETPVNALEPVPGIELRTQRNARTLASVLSTMGIRTIGDLLELPRKPLAQRFGPALPIYLDRLTGSASDPRTVISAPEAFERRLHFMEDLDSQQALLGPMRHLLVELNRWLTAQQLCVDQLRWKFTHEQFGEQEMIVRIASAGTDTERFLRTSELCFSRTELPERVSSLYLTTSSPVPWQGDSGGLFRNSSGSSSFDDADLNELVDRLRARLGYGACRRLNTLSEHRPERAVRVAVKSRERRSADGVTRDGKQSLRPLWLLDQPSLANPGHMRLLHGPERIQIGWWEKDTAGAPEGRDYYIAEHISGTLCWIYRVAAPTGAAVGTSAEAASNQWFIHGLFS